jgi:hypothetical protein
MQGLIPTIRIKIMGSADVCLLMQGLIPTIRIKIMGSADVCLLICIQYNTVQ